MAGPVQVVTRSNVDRKQSLRDTRARVADRRSERDAFRAQRIGGVRHIDDWRASRNPAPEGWDATTYNNFKRANPTIEPNQEDTARMQGTFTPTVLSDTNIRERVIPRLQQEAAQTVSTYDQNKNLVQQESQLKQDKQFQQKQEERKNNPMGDIFSDKGETAVDPYTQRQLDLIDQTLKSSDAATRRQAERQKTLFDRQRQQQMDVANAEQGALGVAAQRLGSRYTPGARGGLMAQAQRANLEKLAQIDEDEMSAVEELRAAQENKDFQAIDKKLGLLKDVRDERMKTLEAARKAEADEKKAVSDVVMDAAKNGAPAEVRAAIAAADTAAEAVALAGDYLQEGTGVIGEYLFYKRQAEAMGQIPLSFDKYQDMDANRKIPASRSGTSGLSSKSSGPVSPVGLVDATGKPVKLTATQVEKLTALNDTEGTAKEALALMQKGVNTGPIAGRALQGAKLTGMANEDQLKLEQVLGKLKADYIKSISGAAASESEVKRLSKFLPDIDDTEQVINSKIGTIIQEINRNRDNFKETLGVVNSLGDTATDLLQTEQQAKDQVDAFYAQHPEQQATIESLLEQEFTNAEVSEYLRSKGLI